MKYHETYPTIHESIASECKAYVNASQDNHMTVLHITSFFECLSLRHPETAIHSILVAEYSYMMGKRYDPQRAFLYYLGGISHDLGKITFPDYILDGQSLVKESDRLKIKKHVKDGVQFLSKFGLPDVVMNIVRFHHERFDGKGYLEGLKGMDIPFEARVAAIADVYCAIRDPHRKYKEQKRHDEAITIMREITSQFDPSILDNFCEIADIYQASLEAKGANTVETAYFSSLIAIPLFGGYKCYSVSKQNRISG